MHNLTYLHPKDTHKLLGVHLNPILNFKKHFSTITAEVRKISKILKKEPLSTKYKLVATETLLKSKYFTLGLGLLTTSQLKTIDGIICSSIRNAYGATPSLPRTAILNPTDDLGLGHQTVLIKAARQSIEQLTNNIRRRVISTASWRRRVILAKVSIKF